LWESGAVTRYLCARYSMGNLCPEDLRERAAADKWMDWSSINLAPSFNQVYLAELFKPQAERDEAKIADAVKKASAFYDILDAHLATNDYLAGDRLTMADFPAGSLTDRWIKWTPDRPSHPNVEAYYERLAARPAYRKHVIEANAPRLAMIRAG
jgi:glutathione S-transferase